MAAVRSVRLSQSPVQEIFAERKATQAPEPDQRLYGIYGPQYAASLGKESGSSARDALQHAALRLQAAQEREDYAAQLKAAQDLQLLLARESNKSSVQQEVLKAMPGYVDRGMGALLGDLGVNYGVFDQDPAVTKGLINRSDNVSLNAEEVDRLQKVANTASTLSGTEYAPDKGWVEKMLVNPAADPNAPYGLNVPVAPGANLKLKQYGTDEGLTAEEQLQKAAMSGKDEGGSEAEVTVQLIAGVDENGNPTEYRTIKGTPTELRAMGIDPDTGRKITPVNPPTNPNAGAQGGGTPATPAANNNNNVPKTGKIDLQDASSIGNKFGRVTSTMRTKKHNRKVGGVKNSYHLSGRAIDIARAKGVKHKDIERAYKQAGYDLIESLDEGDHSHFAFSHGPVNANAGEQIYAARLKALPYVADVKIVDGQTLVTTKSGKTLVFKRGNRIG